MRKFTITFKPDTDHSQPKDLELEADDVNMGAAGNIPCLIFFEVSTVVAAGPGGPSGKILHIVPLDNVISCTSDRGAKLSFV